MCNAAAVGKMSRFLLDGPPGGGKRELCRRLGEHNAIVSINKTPRTLVALRTQLMDVHSATAQVVNAPSARDVCIPLSHFSDYVYGTWNCIYGQISAADWDAYRTQTGFHSVLDAFAACGPTARLVYVHVFPVASKAAYAHTGDGGMGSDYFTGLYVAYMLALLKVLTTSDAPVYLMTRADMNAIHSPMDFIKRLKEARVNRDMQDWLVIQLSSVAAAMNPFHRDELLLQLG